VDLQEAKNNFPDHEHIHSALEKPLAKINKTYNCRKMWHTMLATSQMKRGDVYGIAACCELCF
jgi:hypothetical protein